MDIPNRKKNPKCSVKYYTARKNWAMMKIQWKSKS